MKYLVFLEQRGGQLKASSKEALGVACHLAGGQVEQVAGVLIGKDVEGLASEFTNCGAHQIYTVNHESLDLYNVETYTEALGQVVREFSPQVILGMASPMGRDLFPRLAARLDAGLLTDLVDVTGADGDFTGGTKPMFAGKVLAQVAFTESAEIKMATLRPNVFSYKTDSGEAKAQSVSCQELVPKGLKTLEIKESGQSNQEDLTEAGRIISGGRSLGSAEKFSVLDECAQVLGATVGASRAAVDSGYAPHSMQVGQTGKTVNPNLYIACGISGSIQHMAGMRTSKIIVAINTDPEAPIFTVADYGIVGDLFEVVPILTEKLKEIL